MSNQRVLVLPYPAQGHVNSLMNLSRNLAERGLKILFVNTDFNHKRMIASLADQDSLVGSNIEFVSIPDGLGPEEDRNDLGKLCSALLNAMPGILEKLIEDIRVGDTPRISCIVADVSMGWAMEVAKKLGIRGALLWTASAAIFALQFSIPRMIEDGIIDSNGSVIQKRKFQLSPSMPIMDTNQIFWYTMGDEESQKHVFHYCKHLAQIPYSTEWWLCNTTYELEPGALSFIPNLLPIGPFMGSSHSIRSLGQFWEEDLSCLNWLDQQPPCSVIYIAFGSFTLFNPNQFKELALGLELTDRPFLWVVRSDVNSSTKYEYPDEFHGNLGKIVGWAPQKQVLSHPATACFITHCGWNSTIEGLSSGVPFLCWPYFGDQIFNKDFICDELKVGLGCDSDEEGIISSEEIKKKVEQLMKDENIRARSMKLKEMLISNLAEGGRSSENFNKFVKWLKE